MTSFPNSPKLLQGGIVPLDPVTSTVRRIIALQCNPDSISRTLQVQGMRGESGDRLETLRLKGPWVATIKVEAEIGATNQTRLLQASVTTELTRLLNNGGPAPNLVEGVALPRMSTSGIRLTGKQPDATRTATRTIGAWGHRP